jgi:hypothetical protein
MSNLVTFAIVGTLVAVSIVDATPFAAALAVAMVVVVVVVIDIAVDTS